MALDNLDLHALHLLVEARLKTLVWDKDRLKWEALAAKLKAEMDFVIPTNLVFRLDLPLVMKVPRKREPNRPPIRHVLCPTLNEYDKMHSWQQMRAREEVDRRIEKAKEQWPKWHWGGVEDVKMISRETNDPENPVRDVAQRRRHGGVRRGVRVIRRSSRQIDELSIDVVGGKIPIDRLVDAFVLGGDSAAWLDRKAEWEYAEPEHGSLTVEVYDLAPEIATPRIKGR